MRNVIKKIYLNTAIGPKILNPLLRLRNLLVPQNVLLKSRFKRILGYKLDLKNPKTLNEKIQWLKINDRSDIHTTCADKYRVRSFILDKIGEQYLIPLIFQTDNIMDLKVEVLPNFPVIIKTNHDSGGGIIVKDKIDVDWKKIHKQLYKRMSSNYSISGKGEWQYEKIKPHIIIEKLLLDTDGNIPKDFKMHCFNGKLAFTQVDMDRQTNHKRNLYDKEWNFIPCVWTYPNGPQVPKPEVYDQMIKLAETLAAQFLYVRVDFYVVSNKIYFGELTFHSDSGNGRFIPPEYDLYFGKMLNLPI